MISHFLSRMHVTSSWPFASPPIETLHLCAWSWWDANGKRWQYSEQTVFPVSFHRLLLLYFPKPPIPATLLMFFSNRTCTDTKQPVILKLLCQAQHVKCYHLLGSSLSGKSWCCVHSMQFRIVYIWCGKATVMNTSRKKLHFLCIAQKTYRK